MSEDEATELHCCGPLALHPGGSGFCIASRCMAWRWSETKRTAAFLDAVRKHMASAAKPNFNASVQAVYAETGGEFERSEGHCGLAGRPE